MKLLLTLSSILISFITFSQTLLYNEDFGCGTNAHAYNYTGYKDTVAIYKSGQHTDIRDDKESEDYYQCSEHYLKHSADKTEIKKT